MSEAKAGSHCPTLGCACDARGGVRRGTPPYSCWPHGYLRADSNETDFDCRRPLPARIIVKSSGAT